MGPDRSLDRAAAWRPSDRELERRAVRRRMRLRSTLISTGLVVLAVVVQALGDVRRPRPVPQETHV